MTEKHIEVDDINYYALFEPPDSGDLSAPCVLLVHALMSNLHMYDYTVRTLHAAGYSTLRFDHIGHNKTPAPARLQQEQSQRRASGKNPIGSGNPAYHMDDLTRHMHTLVQSCLDHGKDNGNSNDKTRLAGVIGCSIGGVLALRYAMLYPSEVSKVISIAAPGIRTPPPAKELWTDRIEIFRKDVDDGDDELCRLTAARWVPISSRLEGEENKARDETVRSAVLQHVRTCSIVGYETLAHTITEYDYDDEVESKLNGGDGQQKGPACLIVAGELDEAVKPDYLEALAGRIEGARFECVKGAGHLPPFHRAREFERLMMDFFGEAS